MAEPKVLFVIAFQGFRDEEYQEPKKILEDNGVSVVTASSSMGNATGKLGLVAKVDLLYSEADPAEYAAVVFIGGPGSPQYWEDDAAHKLIQEATALGRVVAGICSASVTLAKSGVLRERRATVWPGDAAEFEPLVAQYTAADCERDGLFITANGPSAATIFGRRLLVAINELID